MRKIKGAEPALCNKCGNLGHCDYKKMNPDNTCDYKEEKPIFEIPNDLRKKSK
jgi:hypothetical protein